MINHHSIVINAPSLKVYREVLLWGEAPWWPSDSPMRYTRITPGKVSVGAKYHQKVRIPFGPEWDAEVISISPGREVSRKYLNGMFIGVERVYLIPDKTSCEVHFMMDFELRTKWDKFLWNLIYRKKHDENIRKILTALKRYLEGSAIKAQVEEHPATPEEAERRRFLRGIVKK